MDTFSPHSRFPKLSASRKLAKLLTSLPFSLYLLQRYTCVFVCACACADGHSDVYLLLNYLYLYGELQVVLDKSVC